MKRRGVRRRRRVLPVLVMCGPIGAGLLGEGTVPAGGPVLHGDTAVGIAAESAAVPLPVLLVPGWGSNARVLAPLRIRLVAAGWPAEEVVALDFADPTGSNLEHAREIAAAIDSLRARTGAARVDVVAHSMGGLATRLYLDDGGAAKVRRVVFVATPQRGTYAAYFAFGGARSEMLPGSDFLTALNRAPPVPPTVQALTVRTWLDAHVIPEESATLPGVPDVLVCCATHRGLLANLDAFRAIRSFLETGRAETVER